VAARRRTIFPFSRSPVPVSMREVLAGDEFVAWIDGFLPKGLGPQAVLPAVPDRTDAQFAHLEAGLPQVVGGV
jgi:hypothetical protein